MKIHKNGHTNQAGGCCCPICGNTCGYHYEYSHPDFSKMIYPPKTNIPLSDEESQELREADKNLERILKKTK